MRTFFKATFSVLAGIIGLILLALIIHVLHIKLINYYPHSYTEKRPDNFVLSEATPVSIGHPIYGNLSTSTEPVDILSSGIHFRIPRNYIDSILINPEEHDVIFKLVTLYPDFLGVQSGTDCCKLTETNKIWRWGLSPSIVYMDLITKAKKSDDSFNEAIFNAEANQPDHAAKYGLLLSTNYPFPRMTVYFQRPAKNFPGIVVECDTIPGDFNECLDYIRISNDVLIRLQYHAEMLPNWRDIHQKALNLLQKIIVK